MRAAAGRRLLLLPLAAAIAVFPLLLHGPSYGHDFNFHLLSWMDAARQFSHGTLYPRWASSPAYNAGEPRFVFYPPLSWALGALLGLALTHVPGLSPDAAWAAAPVLFTWIALTACGIGMYRAARTFTDERAALLASIVYIATPYLLFTAYERTAFAELLAAAWMPLLLAALLSREIAVIQIAVPVALLWLTNAPAAVIGSYAAAVLVALRMLSVLRAKQDRLALLELQAKRIALPALAGTTLGFALAGFYLIPAAWERRFVQVSMATIVDLRVDHNFLFERTGTSADAVSHDQVLRTASWIAVLLVASATLALLACRMRQGREAPDSQRLPVAPLLCFTGLITCLLMGWSNPVWQHTPELTFLQFPWRLLVVVTPVGALAAAAALSRISVRRSLSAAIALSVTAALTGCAYQLFHQASEPGQSLAYRVRAFQQNQGAEPTDEYTPQTADNDALTPGDPGYWLAADPAGVPPRDLQPGPAPDTLQLTADRAGFLILNRRDYPAWQVELNGRTDPDREQRDDGLITLAIPSGRSAIRIRYAHRLDDTTGDAVSLAAVLFLVAAHVRTRGRNSAAGASGAVLGTSGRNSSDSGE